jgi:hypothetical protein
MGNGWWSDQWGRGGGLTNEMGDGQTIGEGGGLTNGEGVVV